MKRLAPLLLVAVTGTVQAGFENMMNPLAMLAPTPSFNPFAGYGGYGGYGGFSNPLSSPLGGLGTLGGLAALGALGGPALQLAPGLLTGGYLNQLTNPYMGGPFAGTPMFQQSSPMPFAMPGYAPGYGGQTGYAPPGYGAFTPSMPNMPGLPFAAPRQQNTMPSFFQMPQGSPYQQGNPFQQGFAFQAAPAQQPAGPSLFTPFQVPAPQPAQPAQSPLSSFFPPMPQAAPQPPEAAPGAQFFLPFQAPSAPPAQNPSSTFFPPMPQAAPQPAASNQAAAQPAPTLPFMPFMAPPAPAQTPTAPPKQATQATAPVTAPSGQGNALTPSPILPLDPALLMQMFLKPMDAAK